MMKSSKRTAVPWAQVVLFCLDGEQKTMQRNATACSDGLVSPVTIFVAEREKKNA